MSCLKDYLKGIFLITSCIISVNLSNAQELTFTANDIVLNQADTIRMGHIDINNCSSSTFRFFFAENDDVLWYSDMTLDTDSSYYGFVPYTNPQIPENRLSVMEFDPFFTGMDVEYFPESKQGMTCDRQSNLYLAGAQLSRWNTTNSQITELGDLPPNMHCQGDLTFRQGKLYLSSINHTLVEVNLNDPMNSTVVMTFPPGIPEIHGLATVNLECDSVETYAVASDLFNGSTIYRIDFDTWTLEELCYFDFFVTGLASHDECIFPECLISVDLDVDNSAGATGINDFKYIQACTFPLAITDTDISIHSDVEMLDSIIIELTNPLNANEYLSLPSPTNLSVVGNNSEKLILYNNGASAVSDFTLALQNVRYNNDADLPTLGERVIEIQASFGQFRSTIARTFIPINEVFVNAVFDIIEPSCYGTNDASISATPFGGWSPYTLEWSNDSIGVTVSNLLAGSYTITVSDANACTSVLEVDIEQPDSLEVIIDNLGLDTFCGQFGSLEASGMGGTGQYIYQWQDGIEESKRQQLLPGTYTLTLSDQNGCSTSNTYSLTSGTDILTEIVELLCFEDSYTVAGQSFTSDTTFCITSTLLNGCDSIICYELNFYEEILSLFEEEICAGDSLLIWGMYYDTEVNLEEILVANNGCDSVLQFNLSLLEPLDITLKMEGDLFQDGVSISTQTDYNSYVWSTGSTESSITTSEPGTYQVTITDMDGCTAIDSIRIELDVTPHLFVPNVFTPNGDGINDQLKVYGSPGILQIINLSILSRNGHLVYQAENFLPDESQIGWTGMFLDEEAQSGVYILYVTYETLSGAVKQEIYDLTLIR